jgi:hypothetical protein
MTKNQIVRRVRQLRREGVSFRAIERRLRKTLGVRDGNGTVAYRLLQRGA